MFWLTLIYEKLLLRQNFIRFPVFVLKNGNKIVEFIVKSS